MCALVPAKWGLGDIGEIELETHTGCTCFELGTGFGEQRGTGNNWLLLCSVALSRSVLGRKLGKIFVLLSKREQVKARESPFARVCETSRVRRIKVGSCLMR